MRLKLINGPLRPARIAARIEVVSPRPVRIVARIEVVSPRPARIVARVDSVFPRLARIELTTWGDNDENTKEIVELFANEAEENTSTFVEEKYDEVDEIATIPSSSKGKLSSTELRTLKREFQTTKDELVKVASSNRALRNRVRDLKEMV
ncbi:hypothetical protein L3X38_003963 [Prunus dulcis]|uniref:Uncharacterized protein n=1 Tax=Prunus dulcis TaxID=3755 RepID=A0AAD4ZN33_PRUDU|nr:hypothetical protein L3X38_003963 [Prunus dulcis]